MRYLLVAIFGMVTMMVAHFTDRVLLFVVPVLIFAGLAAVANYNFEKGAKKRR